MNQDKLISTVQTGAKIMAEKDKANGQLEVLDYTPIRFAVIVEEFYKIGIKLEDCGKKYYMELAEEFMDTYNEVID